MRTRARRRRCALPVPRSRARSRAPSLPHGRTPASCRCQNLGIMPSPVHNAQLEAGWGAGRCRGQRGPGCEAATGEGGVYDTGVRASWGSGGAVSGGWGRILCPGARPDVHRFGAGTLAPCVLFLSSSRYRGGMPAHELVHRMACHGGRERGSGGGGGGLLGRVHAYGFRGRAVSPVCGRAQGARRLQGLQGLRLRGGYTPKKTRKSKTKRRCDSERAGARE